ncbi:MAG: flagellar biosynthetic protein FliO [Caulobacter sp.]|nr:flagellar biosynthetic protein FliO [Caulobacter sp.]
MDFVEILRAVFALLVTIGLVLLAGWGMRRFGPEAMSRLQMTRKERRLTLVETLVLDPARRLVLVRLDDEERLILLGEGRTLETLKPPARRRKIPETAA